MRALSFLLGAVVAAAPLGLSPVQAEPEATILNFAVMRNGERIGTSTIRVRHSGPEMLVDATTHIEVKIAFVTVYRFDQRQSEHWADGRLVAMTARTDDNGTPHAVSAARHGEGLVVEADGKTSHAAADLIPFSPWNDALLHQRVVLSPQDGKITPLSVTDHGEEQLVLQGRPTTARHYSIKTSFPQEIWYDQQRRLVQVELSGSDGSKIRYRLG